MQKRRWLGARGDQTEANTALQDLSDLTTDERQTLASIVLRFRRAHTQGTEDEAFARFWDAFLDRRASLPDEEADTIAGEAVSFARGRV